jgi:hypothetical protein
MPSRRARPGGQLHQTRACASCLPGSCRRQVLATACFTATSMTQLATARVTDVALDASTLILHDCRNARQGCMTHSAPDWARPFLRAAVFTHFLTTGSRSDRLFTDPLGVRPSLPATRPHAGRTRAVWLCR